MLKQRVMTAILLALVFISCVLFANHDWVRLMFAVMLGISLFELSNLTVKPGLVGSAGLGLVVGLVFWQFGSSFAATEIKYLLIAGIGLWVGIACWLPVYHQFPARQLLGSRLVCFSLGLFFLGLSAVILVFIHGNFEQGGWILLYLMTLVWIANMGAYFNGRRFGKNKLAPAISPGKTWEGVIGGLFAAVIWVLLVYALLIDLLAGLPEINLLGFIMIGLATSAISIVGDLFESVLKRQADVKDSGHILPGHGGLFDRVDGVIAATPIFGVGLFLTTGLI